jgi:hypothetical protein
MVNLDRALPETSNCRSVSYAVSFVPITIADEDGIEPSMVEVQILQYRSLSPHHVKQ